MSKIGYNIAMSWVDNQAIENAVASGADKHLIMTESDDAARQIGMWKDRLSADKIVWREYSRLEGNWSVYPNNVEIVEKWKTQGHRDIIRDDPTNEPSLDANNSELNQRYVKTRVDLLHIARTEGIKVAVGAFSVGTPHEDMINAGIYDDLIRAVVAGGHYFSVHEYCPGIPGAGDVFPYSELLNPQTVVSKMKQDIWGLDDYWLLRRSDRFVKRARELGIADPQIIVTEAFIDNIDMGDVREQLRRGFGLAEYNYDLRGVLAWREYWFEAFGTRDLNAIVQILTKYAANKVFNQSWIKGVCLFSLNKNWDTPEGHNWLNEMLRSFRETSLPFINAGIVSSSEPPEPSEYTMPPPHSILWGVGTLEFEGLNFREQPTLDSDIIRTLDGTYRGMLNEGQIIEVDGYNWVAVYIVLTNEYGWVAKYKLSKPDVDFFTFVEDEIEVPEPEPEKGYIIDLLGMSMIVSETEYQKLLTFHRNIVTGLENSQTTGENKQ